MEVILILIYSFFVWLIFIKFKLLPWNITSQVIVVTIPIIGLTIMPIPQTDEQRRVEHRIADLADTAGRRLGLGRRRFLAGAGGVAASFLAMNEVYGQFFDVDRDELYRADAALPNAPPADLFVFDDQLHMVRSSMAGPLLFLAFVQGETAAASSPFKKNPFQREGQLDELGKPWAVLDPKRTGVAINSESLHLSRFIQDVYFDSQVTVGLLSAATLGVFPPGDPNGRPPANYTESQQVVNVTARQTAAIRNFVNRISGSQRLLAHGQIYPGRPNLEFMSKRLSPGQEPGARMPLRPRGPGAPV